MAKSKKGGGSGGINQYLMITAGLIAFGFMLLLLRLYMIISSDSGFNPQSLSVFSRQMQLKQIEASLGDGPQLRGGNLLESRPKPSEEGSQPNHLIEDTKSKKLDDDPIVDYGPDGIGLTPLGSGRAVVVIIAHDRPNLLEACLDTLVAQPDVGLFSIAVSLDAPPAFEKMEAAVEPYQQRLNQEISIWRKTEDLRKPEEKTGGTVAKIAAHFQFALRQSFETFGHEFAILVENDLRLAPDFLWYFRATAPLLVKDPSLFCVSAWHDNGFKGIVRDEHRLFRTDYFPGLGWMVRKDTWTSIKGKWPGLPTTGWDHWMRHGSGLRPRECIVPEVSRTKHVDDSGTNVKSGSQILKLLDRMATSTLPSRQLTDLSYLTKNRYEAKLRDILKDGIVVPAGDNFRIPGLESHRNSGQSRPFLVPYVREEFRPLAETLMIYPGQPRSSRKGLILTFDSKTGLNVALVDRRQGKGILPENELWLPIPGQRLEAARAGESCDSVCQRLGHRCVQRQLEYANACEHLKQYFPCEAGCGHQVGQEIPCYVHDKSRDTAGQCLVTDEAAPSCEAKHPSTTRLCVCVPT
eukprot:TRINITY_DN8082_c1_g4_i1.p1 TRINITY_DN8082_c1_g4~~TRINITY_DN8082_c1_g4_i1.p1  ORF type:complete len:578 (+),score=76.01 TRINITY_DN8082_c1_g4_i1:266-1999(+)